MHDRVIRKHRHHTTPQSFVAHPTKLLLHHDDAPATPALSTLHAWYAIAEEQLRLTGDVLGRSEARDHSRLVDHAG